MRPPSPPRVGARDLLADRGFLAALAVALVVGLGFGLVVPIVPSFARSFGVSVFAATAIVASFPAVRLVSNLITGALSDRIGTRRSVAYGAFIVAASSAFAALAPTYAALLVARGSGGFGSALFFNALMSLVVVAVPAQLRGRAIGLLQSAFLIGIALGPSVGGALAEPLGLRWPFAIYAMACLLSGAIALLFLPRPEGEAAAMPDRGLGALTGSGSWQAVRRLLGVREILVALVMMAGLRWSLSGVRFALVPLFGTEEVGASAALIGYGLTLAAVTQLAVMWPAGKLLDGLGRKAVGWPAFALFAVATAGLGLVASPLGLLVALGVFGVATGFASPVPPAVLGDVTADGRSGLGVGLLNTAGDLGAVAGPIVSGWLADLAGFPAAFALAGALLALGAMLAVRMRETLEPDPARIG